MGCVSPCLLQQDSVDQVQQCIAQARADFLSPRGTHSLPCAVGHPGPADPRSRSASPPRLPFLADCGMEHFGNVLPQPLSSPRSAFDGPILPGSAQPEHVLPGPLPDTLPTCGPHLYDAGSCTPQDRRQGAACELQPLGPARVEHTLPSSGSGGSLGAAGSLELPPFPLELPPSPGADFAAFGVNLRRSSWLSELRGDDDEGDTAPPLPSLAGQPRPLPLLQPMAMAREAARPQHHSAHGALAAEQDALSSLENAAEAPLQSGADATRPSRSPNRHASAAPGADLPHSLDWGAPWQ